MCRTSLQSCLAPARQQLPIQTPVCLVLGIGSVQRKKKRKKDAGNMGWNGREREGGMRGTGHFSENKKKQNKNGKTNDNNEKIASCWLQDASSQNMTVSACMCASMQKCEQSVRRMIFLVAPPSALLIHRGGGRRGYIVCQGERGPVVTPVPSQGVDTHGLEVTH
mgnify:CR=1 FL=1